MAASAAPDANAEPQRAPARRRGGGRLPLAALLVAGVVLVAYAASLRADAGLVQSGLAQVRTTLARLSGGRLFDAEEVDAEAVEQGDADVGQLLADDDGGAASNATTGADAAEDGDDGAVEDVNITDIGAATSAAGATAGGALPVEQEEDEGDDEDETAEPSARARPPARAPTSPSKRRPPPSSGGGGAAPAARPGGSGGGSTTTASSGAVEDADGDDTATDDDDAASLPADAAYSWLQPPSAPTQALLDAVRRVAWLRTAPTRPAGGPPCRGVGPSSPQSYAVALGYPQSTRSQSGGGGDDGSGAPSLPPRLTYDPAGVRQTRCVPVGGTIVLRIRSRDKRGRPMCEGGDFYEAQLAHVPDAGSGGRSRYKARPRTVDHGDGSYSLFLTVPPDPALAGTYDVAVTLLFTRYGGLTLWGGWKGDRFYKRPRHWKVRFSGACPAPGGGGGGGGNGGGKRAGGGGGRGAGRQLAANTTAPAGARRAAAAATSAAGNDDYVSCREYPFADYPLWAGHWVNVGAASGGACVPPYCTGSAARLGPEAEGWVYRLPRCYFHLFSAPEARTCLAGRWLAMFGDSNHQDTGRNVFHYVLDAPIVRKGASLPRTYDVSKGFDVAAKGGGRRRASLRITNLFTGHYETLGNNLGVRALAHAGLRERHWPLATGNPRGAFGDAAGGSGGGGQSPAAPRSSSSLRPPPSALVFNSGLHDALFMPGRKWSPARYVDSVRDAAQKLWAPLVDAAAAAANATGAPPPRLVWHTTVAPAGVVNRRLPLNPQKVEVMNRLTVGELRRMMPATWAFIDYYDLTFPWHWCVARPGARVDWVGTGLRLAMMCRRYDADNLTHSPYSPSLAARSPLQGQPVLGRRPLRPAAVAPQQGRPQGGVRPLCGCHVHPRAAQPAVPSRQQQR
jgi:hypothetical protein